MCGEGVLWRDIHFLCAHVPVRFSVRLKSSLAPQCAVAMLLSQDLNRMR